MCYRSTLGTEQIQLIQGIERELALEEENWLTTIQQRLDLRKLPICHKLLDMVTKKVNCTQTHLTIQLQTINLVVRNFRQLQTIKVKNA